MTDKMTLIDVRDRLRNEVGKVEADSMKYAECAYHTPSYVLEDMADAIDAHIAAMGEPVAWQFQGTDGTWRGFTNERHRINTIEDGRWPIRALYVAPPASGDWDKVRGLIAMMRVAGLATDKELIDQLTAALPENAK